MKRIFELLIITILIIFAILNTVVAEEENSVLINKLVEQIPADSTVGEIAEHLSAYEQEYGTSFTRRVSQELYNKYYRGEYYIAWLVWNYCEPLEEPAECLPIAQEFISLLDFPLYNDALDLDLTDEAALVNCAGAYLTCLYSYYMLNDVEHLYDCAAWLISYAGFNEECFSYALNACDYAVYVANQQRDADKVRYYVKQFSILMNQYGEKHSAIFELYQPEYEKRILPLLENYQ